MEYAEEKPWVTPSEALLPPWGTRAEQQLSRVAELDLIDLNTGHRAPGPVLWTTTELALKSLSLDQLTLNTLTLCFPTR